jgi:RNA polymerase sigma-70 factor (ECF subfamily)
MDKPDRAAMEAQVRELCTLGRGDDAATAALKGYGPEILGFILALVRSEDDASDVFSIFSEDLWRGLPGFVWQCSLRTWSYTLARHAVHRFRTSPHRDAARRIPLSQASALSRLGAQLRTTTLPFLRASAKSQLDEVRRSLPEDDQTLLILRVDKGLDWNEIARVMAAGEEEPTGPALSKEAARLRKRFQLLKDRLRELAAERGLLTKSEG